MGAIELSRKYASTKRQQYITSFYATYEGRYKGNVLGKIDSTLILDT